MRVKAMALLLKAQNSVDEQLRDLIAEVHRYDNPSLERQKALNRLLRVVQRLPGILTSAHPDYLDALNRTWEWLSRNIDRFHAATPLVEIELVNWINGYLRWRIRDLYSPDEHHLSLDQPINSNGEEQTPIADYVADSRFPPRLTLLDIHILTIQQNEYQRLGKRLKQYIEQDPKGQLRSCHPRQHQGCHCQVLAQRLLFKEPPDKLTKIAKDFNINYQTLNSHWKQRCLPLLQDICRSFGYTL
jgi:hypothetical protein